MQETFQSARYFYRVLANEERLKILGLLAWEELSATDLAGRLCIKLRRVQHHLMRLSTMNVLIISTKKGSWTYRCNPPVLQALCRQLLPAKEATPADSFTGDAWEHKVLQNFFIGMHLKDLPMSKLKRQVITRWLFTQFEPEKRYTEAQVNTIIQRHHADTAFFRKELVGMGLMRREKGMYWCV